jgi:oligoendopeptidase F
MRRKLARIFLTAAIACPSRPLAAQARGDAAEALDRPVLDSLAAQIRRTPVPRTSAAFGRLLHRADSVAMLVRRDGDYWHLRSALDTRDRSSHLAEDGLYQLQDSVFAAVRRKLAALDRERIARFFAAAPALAKFRPFVDEARRDAARSSAPAGATLASVATGWQFDLYEQLIARTEFGAGAGPDTATRDLLAFTVVETVRAQNAVAQAHGFRSRPAEAYAGRGLTIEAVRRSIAAVRAHGAIMQRFERAAKAARSRAAGTAPLSLTFEQALAAMRDTYGGLSPAYAVAAGKLLDPAGGRLRIVNGEHRRAGGFSFALRDGRWGVYLDQFGGSPAQISRLMHESGHALHKQFFYESGAPYLEDPPSSEAVALFGEILLAERLAATAATAADSLAWRLQFLTKMLEVFYGAKDAELEQTIYDSAAGGGATAGDLDRLTRQVDSAYSGDPRPALAGRWMRVRLVVEDPLYLSNYLESGLICLALYGQYHTDPRQFSERYLAFLRDARGGSAEDAIARDFGVRLDDPAAEASAFGLLDGLVGELEAEVTDRP